MSHRPYPSVGRARRQIARHAQEAPALTDSERFTQGLAALRGAGWRAQELATAWHNALRPRAASNSPKRMAP